MESEWLRKLISILVEIANKKASVANKKLIDINISKTKLDSPLYSGIWDLNKDTKKIPEGCRTAESTKTEEDRPAARWDTCCAPRGWHRCKISRPRNSRTFSPREGSSIASPKTLINATSETIYAAREDLAGQAVLDARPGGSSRRDCGGCWPGHAKLPYTRHRHHRGVTNVVVVVGQSKTTSRRASWASGRRGLRGRRRW